MLFDTRSYADALPKPLGGALCLDFINSVEWRADATRMTERLYSYEQLVHWSAGMGCIDRTTADVLLAAAGLDARVTDKTHSAALLLRQELEGAFDPQFPSSSGLALAQGILQDSASIGHFVSGGRSEAHSWRPVGSSADLRLPLLPVAISALELAMSARRKLVHRCNDAACGWVFIDESRNQSRRWCSMSDCGNRAKARAHYAKVRQQR